MSCGNCSESIVIIGHIYQSLIHKLYQHILGVEIWDSPTAALPNPYQYIAWWVNGPPFGMCFICTKV